MVNTDMIHNNANKQPFNKSHPLLLGGRVAIMLKNLKMYNPAFEYRNERHIKVL